MYTKRIVVSSVKLKPPSGSAYVCGHIGTIFGLDIPCTDLGRPGLIDGGQGQAQNIPRIS